MARALSEIKLVQEWLGLLACDGTGFRGVIWGGQSLDVSDAVFVAIGKFVGPGNTCGGQVSELKMCWCPARLDRRGG